MPRLSHGGEVVDPWLGESLRLLGMVCRTAGKWKTGDGPNLPSPQVYGSFRKLGVPYFGVLKKGSYYLGYYIRLLGSPFSETPI